MPSEPQPLPASHHVDSFECGEPALVLWLKRKALANQVSGASRTLDALHDQARQFYEHYGFGSSPTHAMTLVIRLALRR